MNKNILIGATVVLLLVAGGGILFLNRSHVAQQNPSATQTSPDASSAVSKKSFRDFLSFDGSQQCTFSDAESATSGTVYAQNGKVRGDFQAKAEGKPMQSHILADGQYVYMWVDGETRGFKASMDVVEDIGNSALEQSQSSGVDMNKQVDYSCSPWGGDASKFAAPANVEFADYSKMMEVAGQMMQKEANNTTLPDAPPQLDCSICDSLPTDAQAECRASLKCE